ncbi:hypothetical protein ACTFIR_004781 [Dictyostelium discoideum]
MTVKDFKYPECRKRNPNSNNQYFEEIKVGTYELKNQKHYSYMEDIGICRYFYPTIDNEQLTKRGVGVHKVSPLYFLQINDNLSLGEILKSIVNKCNQRINQIINDEELLLKQLKEQEYTENQLNQVNIIFNYIHYIIQGNIGYSKCSKKI